EGKISRRSTGWLGREDNRRLQPLRYLHDCSDCFRLERLPGGVRTHWKAPPLHGAHPQRTLGRKDNGPRSIANQAAPWQFSNMPEGDGCPMELLPPLSTIARGSQHALTA